MLSTAGNLTPLSAAEPDKIDVHTSQKYIIKPCSFFVPNMFVFFSEGTLFKVQKTLTNLLLTLPVLDCQFRSHILFRCFHFFEQPSSNFPNGRSFQVKKPEISGHTIQLTNTIQHSSYQDDSHF